MLKFKYDLGVRALSKEWGKFFSKGDLKSDFTAGLTVACIAIPLSLAIALASGVPPVVGLITAIVAGIVCAFFGGTPLSVSGPAAAMSVLVAANVEQFGLGGLLVIGLICGFLQIVSGIFGIGSLMKFFPLPVIGGFMAGIGVIILIGQLPRAFDLPPPDQAHVIDVLMHIGTLFSKINLVALSFCLLSLAIMMFLPKINKKLPAALIAIAAPTLILYFLPAQDISVIGKIPNSLPWPTIPKMPTENFAPLIVAAFGVYFLASLETLLSSSALDKMVKKEKHDPNQELIGQGLGNMASAMFGGIPVTGVIARSSLNFSSGAKTRRASIIHSLILVACVYLFAPIIQHVPIAALAGILISISFKMLDIRAFFSLFQVSKSDSYIFMITLVVIVFADLIVGIQAGLLASLLIVLIKVAQTRIFVDSSVESGNTVRCSIEGPLTFLSSSKIEYIKDQFKNIKPGQVAVIDLTQLTKMDISGAALLLEFVSILKAKGVDIIVKGLTEKYRDLIIENTDDKVLPFHTAEHERDIFKFGNPLAVLKAIKARFIHGNELFLSSNEKNEHKLLGQLADNQSPHTLFITCSDSRIVPNLITSSDPGELFVVRNVGNVIPNCKGEENHSEGAAIEFALNYLNVKTAIICGHANCGAVHASYKKYQNKGFNSKNSLDTWLEHIHVCHKISDAEHFDSELASKENVLHQMKQFLSYPLVQEKVNNKQLAVFSWYYDIGSSSIQVYSNKNKTFISLSEFKKQIDDEFLILDPTYSELLNEESEPLPSPS